MDSKGEASLNARRLREGRVIDAAGNPVSGALVSVVWGTAPTPEIGRRTNESGAFHVGLPQGRFRVQAVAPSGGSGTAEVDGSEGGEIVIQLE